MSANETLADCIEVVGLVLYANSSKKSAIFRRGPEDSGAGFWEFPGGKIDDGETRVRALVREIFEELSLKLDPHQLEYIQSAKYSYPTKNIHLHLYGYQVPDENIKFCLTDHDQYRWADASELDGVNFSPADLLLLAQVKAFMEKL